MFCSRAHENALDELKGHGDLLWLSTADRTAGIRAYAWQRVSSMPVLSSTKLQELVVDEVCGAAEGLWLYARLMLNEIQHLPNLAMIQHQLQNIPRGLRELYTHILTTLASTLDDWQLRVVQQLFLWIDINDFARIGRWTSLSLDALERALEYVSMGGPIHDPVLLVRRLGSHMIDCFTDDKGAPVVDFIHHTARQYIEWSSTAPSARMPVILQPRRLRALHCGATAAWYLSQHPEAKADCETLKQTHGMIGYNLYFEMVYALWGAFHLSDLSADDLDDEESIHLEELCRQLTRFLSSDQCLTWIEMAILINYAGGFPQLLENVELAIAASLREPLEGHPRPRAFQVFRNARLVFFTDFAHVIRQTAPEDCLLAAPRDDRSSLEESPPAGFDGRPLAQKIRQIGRRYSDLRIDF